MQFGKNLKKLRKEATFTTQEVADLLGVSRQCYCLYEANKIHPNTERLCKIASILNTTPNVLLGYEPERKNVDTQTVLNMQMQIIDTLIESLSDIRDVLKDAHGG